MHKHNHNRPLLAWGGWLTAATSSQKLAPVSERNTYVAHRVCVSWTQGSFTLMHVGQVPGSTEFMALDLSWQTFGAGVSVKTHSALAGNTLLLIDKMTSTGWFRGWETSGALFILDSCPSLLDSWVGSYWADNTILSGGWRHLSRGWWGLLHCVKDDVQCPVSKPGWRKLWGRKGFFQVLPLIFRPPTSGLHGA